MKMKRVHCFGVIASCLALVACDSGIDTRPIRSSDGVLVFAMRDSSIGTWGIYTMHTDGSNIRPVATQGDIVFFPGPWGDSYILGETTSPSILEHPRWSTNGAMIACQLTWAFDGYVILIMDANGGGKRVLWEVSSAARLPQWSPESDKLLFIRTGFLGAAVGIGIVDSSGKNDRNLPMMSPVVFENDSVWIDPTSDFQWGETGNVIYARGSVNRKPDPEYVLGSNPSNEIFALDSETGQILRRVTRNSVDEGGFRISPNGTTIAYWRGQYGKPSTLHMLKPETGLLTETKMDTYVDVWWNWSSEGNALVFAGDINPDPFENEEFRLYLLNAEEYSAKLVSSFMAMQPDLLMK